MGLCRLRPSLGKTSLCVFLTSFQAIFTGQRSLFPFHHESVLVHAPISSPEVLSAWQFRGKKRFCSHSGQGPPCASSFTLHNLLFSLDWQIVPCFSGKPSPIQRDVTLFSGPSRTTISTCKISTQYSSPGQSYSLLNNKEIKPVHPKGNQPRISTGRTDAEAPILWPPDAKSRIMEKTLMLVKIEGRRRRGQQRMRWLDGITDSVDMSLS